MIDEEAEAKIHGTTLGLAGTFSQADIDNNLISFTSGGTEHGSDSFSFTYTDGIGSPLGPATFSIAIIDNVPPTVSIGAPSATATRTGPIDRAGHGFYRGQHRPYRSHHLLTRGTVQGGSNRYDHGHI